MNNRTFRLTFFTLFMLQVDCITVTPVHDCLCTGGVSVIEHCFLALALLCFVTLLVDDITVVCLYEALFQLEHLAVEDASSLLGLIKVMLLFCYLSLGSIAL